MNYEFEKMLRQFMKEHPDKKKPIRRRRKKYKDYKKKALRYEDWSVRKNIKSKYYNFEDLTFDDLDNARLEIYEGQVYSLDVEFFQPVPICDFSECGKADSIKNQELVFQEIDSVFHRIDKEYVDDIKEFVLEKYNDYYSEKYRSKFYYNLYDNPRLGNQVKVNYTDEERKLLNFFDKHNKMNHYYDKMYVVRNKSGVRQALREVKKEYNTSKTVDTDKVHRVLVEEDKSEYIL